MIQVVNVNFKGSSLLKDQTGCFLNSQRLLFFFNAGICTSRQECKSLTFAYLFEEESFHFCDFFPRNAFLNCFL